MLKKGPFRTQTKDGKLYSPQVRLGQHSVSVNKVLLEHGHKHLFMYCLLLLSHYSDRMESLGQRPHASQGQKYLLSDLHRKKKFTSGYSGHLTFTDVIFLVSAIQENSQGSKQN